MINRIKDLNEILKKKNPRKLCSSSVGKEDLPRRRAREYWCLEAKTKPIRGGPEAYAICI